MRLEFNEDTDQFEKADEDCQVNQMSKKIKELEMRLSEKAPIRVYNEQTGMFEYKDPELRKKAKQRYENKDTGDKYQKRSDGLKKHLGRVDLLDDMGKTGNSENGKISEKNRRVASIQTQHAKEYILRDRRQR